MPYQIVLIFEDDDNDPRYVITPEISTESPKDNVAILIDSTLVEKHGIKLDSDGFPTPESLEAWHREYNPHLFSNKLEQVDQV